MKVKVLLIITGQCIICEEKCIKLADRIKLEKVTENSMKQFFFSNSKRHIPIKMLTIGIG